MVVILNRLAEQEKQSGADGSPGLRDEAKLIGVIDPKEAPILQQVRREIRVQIKALGAERVYVRWIARFLEYCGVDISSRDEYVALSKFISISNGKTQKEGHGQTMLDPRSAEALKSRATAMVAISQMHGDAFFESECFVGTPFFRNSVCLRCACHALQTLAF